VPFGPEEIAEWG